MANCSLVRQYFNITTFIVFVLLFELPFNSHASTGLCSQLFGGQKSERFSNQKINVQAAFMEEVQKYETFFYQRLKEKLPLLKSEDISINLTPWEDEPFISSYVLNIGEKELGGGHFGVFPDSSNTLDFHINIKDPFYRKTGAFPFILASLLQERPSAERIPNVLGKDNLEFFLNNTFGSFERLKCFKPQKLESMSGDTLKAVHRNILETVLKTPALKVRAKLGFEKITKVVIDPAKVKILTDIYKGKALNADEIPIYFKWTHPDDNQGLKILKVLGSGQLDSALEFESVIHEKWESWLPQEGILPDE